MSQANPVTLESLQRGINHVIEREGEEWDFHNRLYCRLEVERKRVRGTKDGWLDPDFWTFLVDELGRWKAFRTSNKGPIKQTVYNEGLNQLSTLNQRLSELGEKWSRSKGSDSLPMIEESLEWQDVSPLFSIANSLKGANSPMFGSKLCHFLVPSAYFIWDNKLVTSVPEWKEYENYWKDCKEAWLRAADKESVKGKLKGCMNKGKVEPCETYPWATKITELCQFVEFPSGLSSCATE